MSLKSKYVAEAPVRKRLAASVRNRTEAKIDSIGLVVRRLFQLACGKRKNVTLRSTSSRTHAAALGYHVEEIVQAFLFANVRRFRSARTDSSMPTTALRSPIVRAASARSHGAPNLQSRAYGSSYRLRADDVDTSVQLGFVLRSTHVRTTNRQWTDCRDDGSFGIVAVAIAGALAVATRVAYSAGTCQAV